MTSLSALIARLEKATEGSRELDGHLWQLLWPKTGHGELAEQFARRFSNRRKGIGIDHYAATWAPHFTSDIGAATRLSPEGWEWLVCSRNGGGFANVTKNLVCIVEQSGDAMIDRSTGESFPEDAATPALALCIAALRARASQETE